MASPIILYTIWDIMINYHVRHPFSVKLLLGSAVAGIIWSEPSIRQFGWIIRFILWTGPDHHWTKRNTGRWIGPSCCWVASLLRHCGALHINILKENIAERNKCANKIPFHLQVCVRFMGVCVAVCVGRFVVTSSRVTIYWNRLLNAPLHGYQGSLIYKAIAEPYLLFQPHANSSGSRLWRAQSLLAIYAIGQGLSLS